MPSPLPNCLTRRAPTRLGSTRLGSTRLGSTRLAPLVAGLVALVAAARAEGQRTPALADTARARAVADSGAAGNRRVPAGVWSYAASMESEVGLALLQSDGREVVTQVEQTRNAVRWRRPGVYEQRVTAYRARSVGPNISMLGTLRSAWTVPVLYGDRLAFFWSVDTARGRRASARRVPEGTSARPPSPPRDSIVSVHPLGTRRDRFYDYGGGDTVGTVNAGGRQLPLVRLLVRPKAGLTDRVVLFDGELDLDATRWQVVRMRGSLVQYVPRGARPGLPGVHVEAMAYMELENAEVEGRAWLPLTQRFDFQIAAPILGDARAVLRTMSHFGGYALNDTAAPPDSLAPGTLRPSRHALVVAATDAGGARWDESLGAATASVSANDALDVAPDRWRPTGPPRMDFAPERFGDLLHYNRVEGLFTGVGGTALLRDRAPGVSVRGSVGYAWAEGTVRGRASVARRRGATELALRAGRSLDETNDFRAPLDSASAFAALLGVDDRDYVDRRLVSLGIARYSGARGSALRADVARVGDRGALRHVRGGLVRPDTGFRENRPVDEGSYWRSGLTLDYRPDVGSGFLTSGVGARLRYERGDGGLRYQRAEARAVGRQSVGAIRLGLRANAGALFGGLPRQQLFEVGRESDLSGYDYKEFAGDRAALGRAEAAYSLGVLTAPVRVLSWLVPGPAPSPFVGVEAAWTGASSAAARAAVASLGTDAAGDPLSRPSGHVRRSVEAGVELFGSGLKLGVARALEPGARWRAVVRVGGP